MIVAIYFLFLLMMSMEDYRSHTVSGYWVLSVWLLGIIHIVLEKENRWVNVALTCLCFLLLRIIYFLVQYMASRGRLAWDFGGADVRLIPAMMLVQGWDVALTGVFLGLFCAGLFQVIAGGKRKEIPLVPWMSAGCFLIEIIYLFSGKSVI